MELTTTLPKLRLNKRTISRLQSPVFARSLYACDPRDTSTWTVKCTLPECGSDVAGCRTDNLQSCAPCLPPKPTDPPIRP